MSVLSHRAWQNWSSGLGSVMETSPGRVCSRERIGGTGIENESVATVIRGNASSDSNTGARKSESWNETELWRIRGVCTDRLDRSEGPQYPPPGQALPPKSCDGTSLHQPASSV